MFIFLFIFSNFFLQLKLRSILLLFYSLFFLTAFEVMIVFIFYYFCNGRFSTLVVTYVQRLSNFQFYNFIKHAYINTCNFKIEYFIFPILSILQFIFTRNLLSILSILQFYFNQKLAFNFINFTILF